jgi:hypothetical protein
VSLTIAAEVVGPLQVITYLAACPESGEALLIDPGGPAPQLAARLAKEGWRLKWIVNTHGHADHIAGNELWAAQTGAPIVIHALDWDFFRRPEMQAAARSEGFPPLARADRLVKDGDQLGPGPGAGPHPPYPGAYSRGHLPLFPGPSLQRRHPVRGGRRTHRPAGRVSHKPHCLPGEQNHASAGRHPPLARP